MQPPTPSTLGLTPGQATYVIEQLVKQRQLTTSDIAHYLRDLQHEITTIEDRLAILHAATPSPTARTAPNTPRRGRPPGVSSNAAVPAARHVPSNIARSSTPPRTASNTIASNTTAPNASLRKRRSSPALRAQRQLQGRYLGYMRQLTAKEKARFHAIKERDGFPAAITALKQHLRK